MPRPPGSWAKKNKQVDNLLYRAKRELQSILGEEGMELL